MAFHVGHTAFVQFGDGPPFEVTSLSIEHGPRQTTYHFQLSSWLDLRQSCLENKVVRLEEKVAQLEAELKEARAGIKPISTKELNKALRRVKFNAEGGFSTN